MGVSEGWRNSVVAKVLLSLASLVVACAVLLAWMVVELRSRRPATVSASSFEVCDQVYVLWPEYVAYDYGSRPQAEIPSNHKSFDVRSVEPGTSAPTTLDEIFRSWPREISELADNGTYGHWVRSLGLEASYSARSFPDHIGRVEYPGSCSVDLFFSEALGATLPRPDDWAISIYEARGADTTVADELDFWRSTELTD